MEVVTQFESYWSGCDRRFIDFGEVDHYWPIVVNQNAINPCSSLCCGLRRI
jgi:hypothetical protein